MTMVCQKRKKKLSRSYGRILGILKEDDGNFCPSKVFSLIFWVNIFVWREQIEV
jgi:hypothetical protein